jgi:DNA polymerase I-like protein with 3'-5' exonuclease and polymerase domains
VRASAKTVNYSATYGASAKKIAEAADISLKEAKTLHETYWKVNWSVKSSLKVWKLKR